MLLLTNELQQQSKEIAIKEMISDLQPMIHSIALFIRLIQWKERKSSFLLFLSLIVWYKLYGIILCLLPTIIILIKFYQQQQQQNNSFTRQEKVQQQELIDDLTEIRNTFYLISSIKNWLQESDTLCRAYYQYYSISTSKKRYILLFSVTFTVTIIYVGWISLFYQQIITSASSLLWSFILIIMCLYSPWVNPIYTASVRAVSPLIHNYLTTLIDENETDNDDLNTGYTNGYCFEIYHHQRWWIPTGWCNLLLPQDLPLWSDIHLEPTPSIDEFKLPPTTRLNKLNHKNQQKVISWVWIDPHWTNKKDGTDKEGWQYGNWNWRSWSSQSGGIINCTRRQKWSRYAQRNEYWEDIPIDNNNVNCCNNSSIVGGSTTDGSVYNWDTPRISRSSSIF